MRSEALAYYQIAQSYLRRKLFWSVPAVIMSVMMLNALRSDIVDEPSSIFYVLMLLPLALVTLGAICREHLARPWVLSFPYAKSRHLVVAAILFGYFTGLACTVIGAWENVSFGSGTSFLVLLCALGFASGYRHGPFAALLVFFELSVWALYLATFPDRKWLADWLRDYWAGHYPTMAYGMWIAAGVVVVFVTSQILHLGEDSPEYHLKTWGPGVWQDSSHWGSPGWSRVLAWLGGEDKQDFSRLDKYAAHASFEQRLRHWAHSVPRGQLRLLAGVFLLIILAFWLLLGRVTSASDILTRFTAILTGQFLLFSGPFLVLMAPIIQKIKYVAWETTFPVSRAHYFKAMQRLLARTLFKIWAGSLMIWLVMLMAHAPSVLAMPQLWGMVTASLGIQMFALALASLCAYLARRSLLGLQVAFAMINVLLFMAGLGILVVWTPASMASSTFSATTFTLVASASALCALLGIWIGRYSLKKWLNADL